MADWNAYRRANLVEGLKEARRIAQGLHDKSRGYLDDVAQRRMAVRIVDGITGRIADIEAEGKREVHAHFVQGRPDPSFFDDAEGRN